MKNYITIIDYGMGNIRSVQKAFQKVGFNAIMSNNREDIKESIGIVLPGVGAFGDAVNNLKSADIFELIKEVIKSGKPFLGICLGLQLLFETSEENPDMEGLSVFKGKVVKFKKEGLKIPHIGWNQIEIKKESKLLSGIENNSFFYFVHSYYVVPTDKDIILTYTEYGDKFVSGVEKDNIFAIQFHPEKSQDKGLQIIKNFGDICVNYTSH